MKKLVLSVMVVTVLASGFFGAQLVEAQTPAADNGDQAQCYQMTASGLSRVICGGDFLDLYLAGLRARGDEVPSCARGSCLRDNNCYWVGWGVATAGKDSSTCRQWRNQSTDDRALPNGADASGAENSGQDIFGTSREQLQNCQGAACVNNNPITKIAIFAINVLSALIAIVVVGVIITAGIQYSSSGGNPQVTAQAKKRIINAIIALIVYFFLFAILQWLIPGGIFR